MINLPNTFAKGENLTFALNKSLVLAAVSDSYWSDSANISKCIVVYASTEGHQRKRLEFDFSLESPTVVAEWSAKARNAFEIEEIVLIDFDSGSYTIPRASLPSGKGISFAGEGGGGGSVVTQVVHNYVPNGAINDMVSDGTNVYIGGAFTALRFGATNATIIGAADGNTNKIAELGAMPTFNGQVWCFALDGDYLYVGGAFTTVDGNSRASLARLARTARGWEYDASWGFTGAFTTSTNAQATITSIKVSGSVLFLGGTFSDYKPTSAATKSAYYHFIGINKNTFAASVSLSPAVTYGAAKYVSDIVEDESSLYLAFSITTAPMKISANSGVVDATFAPVVANSSSTPMSLAVSGDYIFVAGRFSSAGGVTKYNVAKFNKTTGAIVSGFTSPFTGATTSQYVIDMTLTDDGHVVVGGIFDSAAAYGRNIVKLDGTTGAKVSAFNAGNTAMIYTGARSVQKIIKSGSSLYIFGQFNGTSTSSDPVTCQSVAKLDQTTGALDASFDTRSANQGASDVVVTGIFDGSDLILGGTFSGWGGYSRQGVAKLNKDSYGNWKVDEAFNTSSGGTAVNTLALSGSDLYIGGTFTTWAGSARNRVAKLNATTGALDPNFGVGMFTSGQTTGQFNGVTNTVNKVLVDGSDLVIAGAFTTYSKRSSASSSTTPATPNWIRVNGVTNTETVPANGGNQIYNMVLDGNDLIMGGNFPSWGGSSAKRYLVRCDKFTGVTSWAFNNNDQLWTSPAPSVYILSIIDGKLFVGAFATITGTSEAGTFVVNKDTGAFLKKYATSVFGGNASPHAPTSGSFMSDSTYVYIATGRTSYGVFFRRFNKSTLDIDSTWGFTNTGANTTVIRCAVLVGTEILTSIEGSQVTQMQPQDKRLYSIKASDATQNKII